MTQVFWRLVDILSRALDADERLAVCGDFAESGASGGEALLDVLGLVIRRQVAVWTHWQPWLCLVCIVVPLGMLLSIVSRNTAHISAIYIWLYANNWEWRDLGNSGFRYEFAHTLGMVSGWYLALACWSWTGGFMLGFGLTWHHSGQPCPVLSDVVVRSTSRRSKVF
jgi:hypothetical protein